MALQNLTQRRRGREGSQREGLPRGFLGCCLVMFVIVSVVMMVMAVTFRLQYIAVQDQQALWRSTDVNQYTLMMGNGSSEYPMTVETLFGMAYHCVMICDVQFHPEYGFPINMSGFLIFKDISGPLLTDVHMRFVAFDIQ